MLILDTQMSIFWCLWHSQNVAKRWCGSGSLLSACLGQDAWCLGVLVVNVVVCVDAWLLCERFGGVVVTSTEDVNSWYRYGRYVDMSICLCLGHGGVWGAEPPQDSVYCVLCTDVVYAVCCIVYTV